MNNVQDKSFYFLNLALAWREEYKQRQLAYDGATEPGAGV